MMTSTQKLGVLCVDDNQQVADAIRLKLAGNNEFEWRGWLANADTLVEKTKAECPAIILLDLDMPGREPFEALEELAAACPDTKVVIFSGLVRSELIDRAFQTGAWGYVSKNDGARSLLTVLAKVRDNQVALSPEARTVYDRLR